MTKITKEKAVILYTKGRIGQLAVTPFHWNRLRDSRNHSANNMCDLRISGRIWGDTAGYNLHPAGYNAYTAGC